MDTIAGILHTLNHPEFHIKKLQKKIDLLGKGITTLNSAKYSLLLVRHNDL